QHASLLIEAPGQAVYIDPAMGNYDGLPPAGLVIITHSHSDHLNPKILEKLRKQDTQVVAPEAVSKSVAGAVAMRNGETRTFGKWTVEALPAYNLKRMRPGGAPFHPKGEGNAYVLTFGGKRILIAGDTEGIPEIRALKDIDVAFIPMNLPYTMTPEEAGELVRAFRPKVVYPYHYQGTDLSVFQKALAASGVEVRIRNW
ncbi:MAG: MBL fold metallo-hydrolase, partial [Acidobacteria bacterium]|nr:MBL fold metallo-hydrolase [Acidobacteriota bacterium]